MLPATNKNPSQENGSFPSCHEATHPERSPRVQDAPGLPAARAPGAPTAEPPARGAGLFGEAGALMWRLAVPRLPVP